MSVSSEVRRTLVKSPPELWAELSDPATLARHLGELGEIRIVRTEPDRAVDWEAATADGAQASGRVEIEPSGWGTRVTLSASREPAEPVSELEPQPKPESEPQPTVAVVESQPIEAVSEPEIVEPEIVEPEPRPGFFARLFRRRRRRPEPVVEPEPIAEVELIETTPELVEPTNEIVESVPEHDEAAPEPDISAELEERTTAVLTSVLDRLGAAHHRPFSRS